MKGSIPKEVIRRLTEVDSETDEFSVLVWCYAIQHPSPTVVAQTENGMSLLD
jgi:hypothetical protein